MTKIVSLDDVKATREQLGTPGHEIWRTFFLGPPAGTRDPQAFLVEYAPGRVLQTHFHDADEFQIVVSGSGRFGHHAIGPHAVHFARAYTPYGPIVAGADGLAFLTLRAERDSSGPQKLPEKREALLAVGDRQPWQASDYASFEGSDGLASITPLRRLSDGHGLAAMATNVPAGVAMRLPDARGSGGQYVVLLKGSVAIDSRKVSTPAVAFLAAGEQGLKVMGGAGGAQLLVLNFPQTLPVVESATRSAASDDGERWRCGLCGFVYDEATGQPEAGVAPGTRWRDVPGNWHCSDCDAAKAEFFREGATEASGRSA
ncbi:MAG: rubredoxin [Caldimonas sp.]